MYTIFSSEFWDLILSLFLAGVLGGLIGIEREKAKVPAGFRTHVLVTIGAALVMALSKYLIYTDLYPSMDPQRLGAQVISGIGFLGAGTIIRYKSSVKGLTTAAGLWASACVGLACGIGFYIGAVIATIIILITLISLKKVEKKFIRNYKSFSIEIAAENKVGMIEKAMPIYKELGVEVLSIEFLDASIKFNLSSDNILDKNLIMHSLTENGIKSEMI